MDQEASLPQTIVSIGLFLYFATVLVVSFRGWWAAYHRLRSGEPLLPLRETIPATWGLADILGGVFLIAVLIAVCQAAMMLLMGVAIPTDAESANQTQSSAAMWGFVIAEVLGCLLLAGGIWLRGGGARFVGPDDSQILSDIRLGLIAFCMLSVPVMIIQVLTALVWPYEHPLIDMLVESRDLTIIVPLVVSAAIVAPLAEEFFFRMLFQGWMDDVSNGRLRTPLHVLVGTFWPGKETSPEPPEVFSAEEEAEDWVSAEVVESGNPFQSPTPASYQEVESDASGESSNAPISWIIPIILSSLLFAVMHLGQGAAPIPLFFLSLGLGYLYQRTRCLTACIVVHAMLNGQSMVLLLVKMFVLPDMDV
ncbi:MAG: CPBP family intramembrane glutamic endopeptidase [Pirellulaceae bacterium]